MKLFRVFVFFSLLAPFSLQSRPEAPIVYSNSSQPEGTCGLPGPTGLLVIPQSTSSVIIEWDPVPTATGYFVENKEWPSGNPAGTVTLLGQVNGKERALVTGLQLSTDYRAIVRSICPDGTVGDQFSEILYRIAEGGPVGVILELIVQNSPVNSNLIYPTVGDCSSDCVVQLPTDGPAMGFKLVQTNSVNTRTEFAFRIYKDLVVPLNESSYTAIRSQKNIQNTTMNLYKENTTVTSCVSPCRLDYYQVRTYMEDVILEYKVFNVSNETAQELYLVDVRYLKPGYALKLTGVDYSTSGDQLPGENFDKEAQSSINYSPYLFPNPITDRLHVTRETPEDVDTGAKIRLVDLSGAVVHEGEMTPGETNYEAAVAHLQAGFYMLQVKEGDKLNAYKLVKQ